MRHATTERLRGQTLREDRKKEMRMLGIQSYEIPAGIGDGLLILSGAAAAVFLAVVYFDEIADGLRHVTKLFTPWRI